MTSSWRGFRSKLRGKDLSRVSSGGALWLTWCTAQRHAAEAKLQQQPAAAQRLRRRIFQLQKDSVIFVRSRVHTGLHERVDETLGRLARFESEALINACHHPRCFYTARCGESKRSEREQTADCSGRQQIAAAQTGNRECCPSK